MGISIPIDEKTREGLLYEEEVTEGIKKGMDLFFLEKEHCQQCVEEVCAPNICALKRELNAVSEMKS